MDLHEKQAVLSIDHEDFKEKNDELTKQNDELTKQIMKMKQEGADGHTQSLFIKEVINFF